MQLKQRLSSLANRLTQAIRSLWAHFSAIVGRRPFVSFLVAFGLLLALIALSTYLNRPSTETATVAPVVKTVQVYQVGGSPVVRSQAQVKKTGLASIFAQTGGVVQKIYRKEGEAINKGASLAWISTNYAGGTAASIARQQAQTSATFNQENLDANKQLIAQQRQVAQTNRDNTEQLRSISEKSVSETSGLITQNNEIMSRLDASIKQQQAIANPTDAEKTTLTSLLSQKAQLQSTLNQLNSGLRSTQFQTDTNKQPTGLANDQLSITNKQLDLQEKSLDLQQQLTQLSVKAARIGESLNYPAAPFKGVVQRVAVVPGQLINPGELIGVVKAATTSATLEVAVPREIALQISKDRPSLVQLASGVVSLTPSFVSSQPTTGSLYTIKYQLPANLVDSVDGNTFVAIDLPIGVPTNATTIPFVPLDAIFQTQDGAYVYVVRSAEGTLKASTRPVKLGEVIGNYVAVQDGLQAGDQVIIDRTVLEGDLVAVK